MAHGGLQRCPQSCGPYLPLLVGSPGASSTTVPGAAARKSGGAVVTSGSQGAASISAVALLANMKRAAQRTSAAAAKETGCALVEARLFCLCQMPHSDGVLMVSCDKCTGWFHPQCLGLPLDDAKRQSSFVCTPCQRAQSGEAAPVLAPTPGLYCVCRSADESSVMIACDFCSEW